MAKLHELLAAEKTPTAAWNSLREDTLRKFKNPDHFFRGHSKSLEMIADSPEALAEEAKAREDRPVVTTVVSTLDYALDIFSKAEDLQFQKNLTNRAAGADLKWRGVTIAEDVPVDELLGLEARLAKLREVVEAIPTLDASKRWEPAPHLGVGCWEAPPSHTTKTDKQTFPVVLFPATDKHPAQVKESSKDVVVGTFTTVLRSGEVTAAQKASMLETIDDLLVEIKTARMRANEKEVVMGTIGDKIKELLLEPLKEV